MLTALNLWRLAMLCLMAVAFFKWNWPDRDLLFILLPAVAVEVVVFGRWWAR